jgi:cyclopropane-fatty-acyl-phospholipid synthase
MSTLAPFYQNVQAHYDLSNEFYALFLDPSLVYSCAYFERPGMTLAEAQLAKIDLSLGKCDLQPGQRLLDIGCGWGATLRRGVEKFGVSGIGLTLSKAQAELAQERLADLGPRVEVRLQGWEEFDEPVDRIVTIGAFEHFREERYTDFFQKAFRLLPAGAPLLLHSIVFLEIKEFDRPGMQITPEDAQFLKFITKEIFPGGQLRSPSIILRYAREAGFEVTRQHSLQPHYALTLDCWAERLLANREEAIRLTSEKIYDIYRRYLTGCADYFRRGKIDVVQFSLQKPN